MSLRGWVEDCACGRGEYDPEEHRTCYACYLERREEYIDCIYCGRWHSPRYEICYRCRAAHPGRDEAARDLRIDILIRDEFTCRECGSNDQLQVDHIKPCAIGGDATPWNLQALCRDCNMDKGCDWQPGTAWDYTRIELMHLYFTFGWSMLDDDQRQQLIVDSGIYGDEFTWHAHFLAYNDDGPPDWAIEMADEEIIQEECTA